MLLRNLCPDGLTWLYPPRTIDAPKTSLPTVCCAPSPSIILATDQTKGLGKNHWTFSNPRGPPPSPALKAH